MTVVSEFSKAFNETLGTHGVTTDEEEKIVVKIPDCPHCRGIFAEKPVCYVEIGLLTQLVETAVDTAYIVRETECMAAVDTAYIVRETECMAKGDPVCRFEIEKSVQD
jgi:predicted hydrocarbon binding protein